MLSQLIRQLLSSFGIFFRTIRAFFTRKVGNVEAYGRRLTSVSRYANKVATTSFKGAASAVKKPTKREDYIETKRMFISKSFLMALAVGLAAVVLLLYFVVWPFLLSHFFVAKFYQEDRELDTWSGRVIVYYDKAKTMPMYEGTLEEGVLQGKGTQYDREGLVTFEGDFVDGIYNGKGSAYNGGVLLYDGEFADGQYNGKGSFYEGGKLRYSGDFADGRFEGSGTYYYASGARQYAGAFAAGVFEGEGVEYREDGPMRYKGSFSAGLYEGDGTYYYAEDSFVKAVFAAGVTDGEIQWFRDGKLWYAGGASNLTPDGFGTVYAASGKPVYAGEMDMGTIDGAWLLGLTADEAREAFGEARVSEKSVKYGFKIANATLGLTVLCSYQSDGDEAKVYKVFFRPKGTDLALLPWQDSNRLTQWAMTGRDAAPVVNGLYGRAAGPDGILAGDWNQSKYVFPDYYCIMLWANEHGTPVQFTWAVREGAPAAGMGSVGGAVDQAQARLDDLMEELDGILDGEPSKESEKAVASMVAAADSAESAEALVTALADCYTYTGMAAALEGGRALLEQQLAAANDAVSRGTGSQSEADAIGQKLDAMDRTLAQYRAGAKQAQLTAKYYSGKEPDPAQLQGAMAAFDPASLKAAALCDGAVKYANEVSAGRYEVDANQLNLKVKTALLDLNVAYEDLTAARAAVDRAAASVETQSAAFAKGTADQNALYAAQSEQNSAVAALYEALGTFTHRATALNTLTGGQLSRDQKWMADTFAGIFEGEIERGKQAAEEEAAAQAAEAGAETAA